MIYPTECAKVKRQNTFSVDARLSRAKSSEGQNPLEIYDARWSRFIFAIIETGKTSVTANIPVRDIPGIADKSRAALQIHMAQPAPSSNAQQAPTQGLAYTQRLATGRFAGKTPAEVLKEDPGNKTALKSQYDFLAKNLEKYPRNKSQMDAISEAIKFEENGSFEKAVPGSPAKDITLYDVPMKGLKNRRRSDGRCFVYSVHIAWEIGEQYPVVIRINNFWAFIKKDSIDIDVSSRTDARSKTFRCADSEWSYVLKRITETMRLFEHLNAEECFKDSEECTRKAAEAVKTADDPAPWNIFDN